MVAALTLAAGSAAAVAGAQDTAGDGEVLAIERTILDIEATIVDLDAGTRTSESTEEITIALEADVFFDFDEAELLPDAVDALADVADELEDAGVTEVAIGGHTDAVGSDDYNQQLSERRASAVENYLAGELDDVDFLTEGFGADQPVAANETEDGEDFPEGRALNRRVEIRYAP